MTQALSVQRDHLRLNRRMIIARSILASIASAVPVPLLDDQLTFIIMRTALRRLGREYQVDLDDAAARALIFGKSGEPQPLQTAASTLFYKIASRTWRRILLTYMTAKRAKLASEHFARTTLFDHYCAKLHVGLGLSGERALQLRETMDEAMRDTPGTLGTHLIRRGVLAAARASVRAPVEVAHILSGGTLRRLLGQGDPDGEVEAIEELDLVLDQQLQAHTNFLSRTVTAVELQLSVEGNPYIEHLIDNFERLWRMRQDDT